MQAPDTSDRYSFFWRLATITLVVAVLRFAQDVILPVVLAALLVFLLSPLSVRLMRWKIPRTIAVILTVSVAFAAIGAIGWLVAEQAVRLGKELPKYEANLHQKIQAIRRPHTPPTLTKIADMVEKLGKDVSAPAASASESTARAPGEQKPVPVEVRAVNTSPVQMIREMVAPILHPLTTIGLVIVFVIAILFQREELRDRLVKLAAAGELNVATQALEDAAHRVFRYLWMQITVNVCYGVPIGLGLYFIGVPNALLWGIMATLLRFIPYLGPWISAAFPLLLAVVIDPGWTKVLYVAGLYIVVEVVSVNLIEVILYGASTGVSAVALLFAAVFWTWLWGVGGLVLSTPLTVCLLVLGKYVPGLAGLGLMLGSEPALEPPAQLYQRMLTMESENVFDLAAKYVAEHSLEVFYENVFVPALILAEDDRHRGELTETREEFIFQIGRDLVEELERREENARAKGTEEAAIKPPPMPSAPKVVAIAARDLADEIVALMVAHLLRRSGVPAAAFGPGPGVETAFGCIEHYHVPHVVISALPPSGVTDARRMGRRVLGRFPNAEITVGIWSRQADRKDLGDRLGLGGAIEVVTTPTDAVAHQKARQTGEAPYAEAEEVGSRKASVGEDGNGRW